MRIGKRVIIHSGSVIGSDGFGFARTADESGLPVYIKKYHSGTVEIGDDVEIGALVAVDRALSGVTRLGKGVKLDNLVQVAHNVEIGDGTVVASQVGIAGSSTIGRYGVIGGQAGVKDHVAVGNGVILATRVGIYRNVPDGSVMAGSIPAMPHKVFLRVQSLFKRLPENPGSDQKTGAPSSIRPQGKLMIHPTAVIHPGAVIGNNVSIGPYSVIGEHVVLGDECEIRSHVTIEGNTSIGPQSRVFQFAAIGGPPQDFTYRGEDTRVEIGARVTVREYVTIHRGTLRGRGATIVGDDCYLMSVPAMWLMTASWGRA